MLTQTAYIMCNVNNQDWTTDDKVPKQQCHTLTTRLNNKHPQHPQHQDNNIDNIET